MAKVTLTGRVSATKNTEQGLQLLVVVDEGTFDETPYRPFARDITTNHTKSAPATDTPVSDEGAADPLSAE